MPDSLSSPRFCTHLKKTVAPVIFFVLLSHRLDIALQQLAAYPDVPEHVTAQLNPGLRPRAASGTAAGTAASEVTTCFASVLHTLPQLATRVCVRVCACVYVRVRACMLCLHEYHCVCVCVNAACFDSVCGSPLMTV